MSMCKEYHSLVQEVRLFLESTLPKKKVPIEIKKTQPLPPSPPSLVKKIEPVEIQKEQKLSIEKMSNSPLSIQKETIEHPLIPEIKPLSKSICGSFTLEKQHSFSFVDISLMRESVQKILLPEVLFISLSNETLPFLNKVALALIKHGISCNTSSLKINNEEELKEFFVRSSATTFITEYAPIFTKIYALKEPIEFHKYFFFSDKKCILFLHPIQSYEENILQKRDLWNSLKTLLPQSLSTSA